MRMLSSKVYVIVMLTFFVFYNAGVIWGGYLLYHSLRDNEKRVAINNANYVKEASYYDYYSTQEIGGWTQKEYKNSIYQNYVLASRKNDCYVQFYDYGKLIYDSLKFGYPKVNWDEAAEEITYDGKVKYLDYQYNGKRYMVIKTRPDQPYYSTSIVYYYSLDKFYNVWRNVIKIFAGIEVIVTVLFAIILHLGLKKTLKPLGDLSEKVDEMARGKYGVMLPVKGKDEVASLTTRFNEMSEKVAESMEKLKSAAEAKQEFIDDLGHELRTPLTSIGGYSDYLLMAPADQESSRKALEYISSESKRLQHLSDSLLKLAEVQHEEIGIDEIKIEDLFELLKHQFKYKKKKIQMEMRTDCKYLKANKVLVETLCNNLIENAIRAIDEGGTIKICIHQLDANQTELSVEDNGIGMEEQELQKIAEPFYRVDKARSRQSGGVGLGVSLCHKIVKAHDGVITYESERGKGTKVRVIFRKQFGG